MTAHQAHQKFFLTQASPCPYLPGRVERKVFTRLSATAPQEEADWVNAVLTERGFRRSQDWLYRPACVGCSACTPVRIPVCAFEWRRSRRKTLNRNNDLTRHVRPAAADEETYGLFRKYILARHGHGGMADMDEADFADMLEGTRVACELTSYRDRQGHLRAAMLNDPLPDGLSLIYSFYDPNPEHRSLGRFMILDAVRRATEMGLPFVYLGYWVRGSKAMDYKSRFGPLEALIDGRWVWLPRAS